ncbi:peptidylprolyl isomerase [Moraxella osloensis]|uniref:Chaperone SurA n=1 Tax=Faucicola osloensis TaxID=34062 RepID=A0AAD0AEA5_FAUOS|nr:peptidylprolyl isomerase [Moraxella osloensis]ATQ83263.1 peptidylprolyl isomerase [Moraxella osloensis]ATW85758.1 peptidylprolyl isomerase [Moraxella osloensis]
MNHAVMHNLPNFHRNALSALTSALIYGALLVMPTLNAQAVTAAAVTAKTNTTSSKTTVESSKKSSTKSAAQTTSKSTKAVTANKTTNAAKSVEANTKTSGSKPTTQKTAPAVSQPAPVAPEVASSLVEATPVVTSNSQDQVIDGVIAIVNDTPILRSQLDRAVAQASAQLQAQNKTVPPAQQLYPQVLDQLITKQIQLDIIKHQGLQAEENAVNAALTNLAQQNGVASLAEFQQKLDAQRAGSYQALRQKVSEDLAIQTLQQQQLASRIKISDQDVDNFLKSPESNALEKSQYRTLHIRVPFVADAAGKTSDKQKKQALTVATQIAKNLQAENANIEQIMTDAQTNYNAQIQGGDMGYHVAAELPTELSKNITALEVGQVTNPIATAEGYNVIKLVDKRGGQQKIIDQWHTRHILISPSTALPADMAKQQIDTIYEKLRQGEDFATLASTYSKDPGSASNGGDLGWVSEGDMVPSFEAMMKKTSVNDYSVPFQSQFGWHILKVDEKRQKDVSDVYRKNMAREILYQRMAPQALDDWMQDLRAQAYVKIMQ